MAAETIAARFAYLLDKQNGPGLKIKRSGLTIFVSLAISGCTGHAHLKNGDNNSHEVRCFDSNYGCYKSAREICPAGYDIDHIDESRTGHLPGISIFDIIAPRKHFTLLIVCNTSQSQSEQVQAKSKVAQQCIDKCVTSTTKTPEACFDSCLEDID